MQIPTDSFLTFLLLDPATIVVVVVVVVAVVAVVGL
jgi:hypothetical protein